ncbi:MAG TPA: crotonase/enoyl-CoA hydratase family protein [Actinomycetota bacterium]|nr:crotonase/enoyl-CoA hydratase family protein [Actinomycetota bacterium]
MSYEQIEYRVEDKVATVTLNRPDRLNAFTAQMMSELLDVFDEIDNDNDVRAVIVTGAGRGFCAGADLGAGAGTFDNRVRGGAQDIAEHRDGGGLVTLRIYELTKPIIAAINGPAVGVGITMTLPMDIRLAVPDAKIGFVFARRGLVPEACSSWFLPRVVGIGRAMEWVYTGRVFPATEGHEAGLIQYICEPDQLLLKANEIAREIADNTSALSVAVSRQLLWKGLGYDHPMESHKADSKAIFTLGQGADAAEGVTSFLEKRPASYPLTVPKDLPEWFPWWEERSFN